MQGQDCLLRVLPWAFAALVAGAASGQNYPSKPIRVIDAYPPGGAGDIVLRTIAPKFQESQGQPWVVENRPGAGGIIGAEIASKAAPDGYTLLMFTASYTVHPSIYKNLPYDLTKAFAPVTLISTVPNVLVVHPTVPAHTVKELIALAKTRPGHLNFASGGMGSAPHMAGELFNSMAGIKMTHIPYKGGVPAVTDAVAGHVDLVFATMPTASPHIPTSKLRALGVTTAKRALSMPKLPTIAEAGLPGYEATNSTGLLAPAGTPRDIVVKLQQEIARIMKSPDIQERLMARGIEPAFSTPDQFGEYIRGELVKWAKVVKATGVELQTW